MINNGAIEIVGNVAFTDNVTLSALGTLGIDVTGLLDFDAISVGGDVSLAGLLNVDVDGYTPAVGDSFEIIDVAGTRSGTFAGLSDGALVGNFGGVDLFIDYDGADFLAWQRQLSGAPVTSTAGAVPEPAAAALVALALLGDDVAVASPLEIICSRTLAFSTARRHTDRRSTPAQGKVLFVLRRLLTSRGGENAFSSAGMAARLC